MPAPQGQVDDALADEAGRARKADIHTTDRSFCEARRKENDRPDNRWASAAD